MAWNHLDAPSADARGEAAMKALAQVLRENAVSWRRGEGRGIIYLSLCLVVCFWVEEARVCVFLLNKQLLCN